MTQSLSELRGGSIGTNAQGTAQHRTPTEDNPADYSNLHGQLWMGDHQSSGQLLLTKYVAATRTVEGFPLSCHGISISSPNIGCQREPVFRVEPGARDAEGCEIFQFHSSDDSMLPWPPTPIREAEKTMNISSLIFQVKLERRRTYAAIDPKLFTPDEKHRFRGIWIGEFSSLYRFEFFLLHQPVEGKLEAIKITGDVLIPRGEYSFTVEDLSSSQSRWQARARWRVPLFGVRIAAANLELVNEDEFKLWVDNIFSGFTLTLKRISWGHSPLRASLKATTV
ncbi:hypothetical protein BKA65DRAFT_272060 [Rhexocercosporidium sp. MPI-PUGE-AT-0058]|nr:hypothetical protein BKA65DRAFT_272060 [Rhexocercosporidium sp. MPI-PUGE-AT-0058]